MATQLPGKAWASLLSMFALGEGLDFVLVECGPNLPIGHLAAAIESHCDTASIPFWAPAVGNDVLKWLTYEREASTERPERERPRSVYFVPLADSLESARILPRLSENRDNLVADLTGVLCLVGGANLTSLVARHASSIWAVRAKTVELDDLPEGLSERTQPRFLSEFHGWPFVSNLPANQGVWPPPTPLLVWLAYAPEDVGHAREFLLHLGPLIEQKLIQVQSDLDVAPGQDLDVFRRQLSEKADVVFVLVSPELFGTSQMRLVHAFMARESWGVIPIWLRPAVLSGSPLEVISGWPRGLGSSGWISEYRSPFDAWNAVLVKLVAALPEIYQNVQQRLLNRGRGAPPRESGKSAAGGIVVVVGFLFNESDRAYVVALQGQLKPIEQSGQVQVRAMAVRENTAPSEITKWLTEVRIVLVLLGSQSVFHDVLQEEPSGDKVWIPVHIRQGPRLDWLERYQGLPPNGSRFEDLSTIETEAALVEFGTEMERVVKRAAEIRRQRA